MTRSDGNTYVAERPNRAPTHPGSVIREVLLPSLGINVTQLARLLKVTRQQVHRVLSENSDISPEMAHRLGKLCGNGPLMWSRMQEAYNLWRASERLGDDLEDIPTLKETEKCPACDKSLKDGELVLSDHNNGGTYHAKCLGPDRESYTDGYGDPLKPNDPIPEGEPYVSEPAYSTQLSPRAPAAPGLEERALRTIASYRQARGRYGAGSEEAAKVRCELYDLEEHLRTLLDAAPAAPPAEGGEQDDEAVEVLAKHIFTADDRAPFPTWESLPDDRKADYREDAAIRLATTPATTGDGDLRETLELIISTVENPTVNSLETGFRHSSLTQKEIVERLTLACEEVERYARTALARPPAPIVDTFDLWLHDLQTNRKDLLVCSLAESCHAVLHNLAAAMSHNPEIRKTVKDHD